MSSCSYCTPSGGGFLFQKIKCPQIVNEFQHITKPESSLVSVTQRIHQVRNFSFYLFNIHFNIILLSARRNSKVRPSKLHTHCPSPHYRPHASHIQFSLIFSSRRFSERSKNHEISRGVGGIWILYTCVMRTVVSFTNILERCYKNRSPGVVLCNYIFWPTAIFEPWTNQTTEITAAFGTDKTMCWCEETVLWYNTSYVYRWWARHVARMRDKKCIWSFIGKIWT